MARFRSNHGVHARVLVNDVPMYDRSVLDYCCPTYPATPWFISGENQVVLELSEAPLNEDMKVIPSHFHALFFHQGANIQTDETTLYEEEYPKLLEKLPAEERHLPCSIQSTFTPSGDIPKPIWADVPKGPVPEKGTPELLKAYSICITPSRGGISTPSSRWPRSSSRTNDATSAPSLG